jgi:hypothetical protein
LIFLGDFPEANFDEDKAKKKRCVSVVEPMVVKRLFRYEEINILLEQQGLNKNVDIIKGNTFGNATFRENPHYLQNFHCCILMSILYEPTKHILEKNYKIK